MTTKPATRTPGPLDELIAMGWTREQLTPERLSNIARALRRQAEKYRAKGQYSKASNCITKAQSYER